MMIFWMESNFDETRMNWIGDVPKPTPDVSWLLFSLYAVHMLFTASQMGVILIKHVAAVPHIHTPA